MNTISFFKKTIWLVIFLPVCSLFAQQLIQKKQTDSEYKNSDVNPAQKSAAQGCLEGEPSFAFLYTPACMGALETADGLGRTGQYSKVAVTEGTEYTFSLSEPSYFITISDEEGTTALASGTGSVTWTADFSGIVRYYTHLNPDCEWNDQTFMTKYVQCNVPIVIEEPDFPCFQGDGLASTDPETGYNIGIGENAFRTADDFIVEEGTTFTVQQVRMNVLSPMQPTEFTLNFRADNAGSPGTIEKTVVMAPSSQRIVGTESIYNVYEVTLNLENPIVFEAGTHWLQPEAFALVAGTAVFWELSLIGSNGAVIQTSTDYGETWQQDSSGYQAVFFISGECNPALGVSDMSSSDFAYYPNPANDIVNIRTKKTITSVTVYNMAGQKIWSHGKIKNGQIDISTLPKGEYMFKVTLKEGAKETFKIIKK